MRLILGLSAFIFAAKLPALRERAWARIDGAVASARRVLRGVL